VDRLHELRDQRIEVRVALAVAVAGQVHRDAIQRRGEIRAVVEVEPAQEVLVRLPVAGMLGGDQSGHRLQHLARPLDGPLVQMIASDVSLARRLADLQQGIRPTGDHHPVQVRLIPGANLMEAPDTGHSRAHPCPFHRPLHFEDERLPAISTVASRLLRH